MLRGSLELSPQNRKTRLGSGGSGCLFERMGKVKHILLWLHFPHTLHTLFGTVPVLTLRVRTLLELLLEKVVRLRLPKEVGGSNCPS